MNLSSPLGYLYGKFADLRNTLYERGTFASHELGAKTISIGNITTGGTGKTPIVAYVAEILAGEDEKVCILTRGYGRQNPGQRVLVSDGEQVLVAADIGGDEPVELAHKLIGKAIVVADANRVDAAAWAKEKFGVTAFVLDDGFQHRRVKRHLDIVCIDATDPFGGGHVVPAGRLREPSANIDRADAIVITRADLVDPIEGIVDDARRKNPHAPVFTAQFCVARYEELFAVGTDKIDNSDAESTTKAFAFSGLGNSSTFVAQLRKQQDLDVVGSISLRDHHRYRQLEIDTFETAARMLGAEVLVTTRKDAVKLSNFKFSMDCYVAALEVKLDDPDTFRDLVLSV